LISIDSTHPISRDEEQVFENALRGLKHFQWYFADVLYRDARIMIGRSYYDGYPFTVFRSKEHITLIEGAVYNKSNKKVKEELDEISLDELSITELSDKIKGFLNSTHGEFLVMKYDKETGKCLIFNDALGRLPFYYCSSTTHFSNRIALSREVKFNIQFLDRTDLDTMAVAEYLIFGYPLGERTLLGDVKRLPPASMLIIGTQNNVLFLKNLLSWNMDLINDNDDRQGETRKLVDLFLSSLKDIARTFPEEYMHIMSLSGGLDSRATLAGLVKVGADPIAYSFLSGENAIARKVAQALKVRYKIISSSFKITNEEYVKLTDGLLDIGLRPRISYLYGVRQNMRKKALLYTGDGGDKTMGPLGLELDAPSLEKLIEYIIKTNHVYDLNETASILNIHKDTLRTHLKEHVMAYPEKTLEGKFMHFMIFERGLKWLFVGEDRNRFFVWSITPFYSIDFFNASMKRSQRLKKHYILYKSFLVALNPVLPRVRYYDRLIPLSIPSWLLKLYLTIFEWLKKHFYQPGRANPIDFLGGRSTQEDPDEIRKSILQSLAQRNAFNFLGSSQVFEIIKKEKNPVKLNTLATLVLYSNLVSPPRCA